MFLGSYKKYLAEKLVTDHGTIYVDKKGIAKEKPPIELSAFKDKDTMDKVRTITKQMKPKVKAPYALSDKPDTKFNEDVSGPPTNNAGSGTIAGLNNDPTVVRKKKPKLLTRKISLKSKK